MKPSKKTWLPSACYRHLIIFLHLVSFLSSGATCPWLIKSIKVGNNWDTKYGFGRYTLVHIFCTPHQLNDFFPWLYSRLAQFLRSPTSERQLNGRKMTVRSRRFRRGAFELAKMNNIEMTSRRVRAEGAHATAKKWYFLHVWVYSNFDLRITTPNIKHV